MSDYFEFGPKAVERIQHVIDDLSKKGYCDWQKVHQWCFQIPIKDIFKEIKAFSISAVKIVEWGKPETKVLEIALIGYDDKCIYISSLGYDDVKLFDDIDKVIVEIERLKSKRCSV